MLQGGAIASETCDAWGFGDGGRFSWVDDQAFSQGRGLVLVPIPDLTTAPLQEGAHGCSHG